MGTKIQEIQIDGCSVEHVNTLRKAVRESHCTVIIGVGGGKVIDVNKYTAALENINFLSIPTSASNDGIASPIAVIEEKGHKKSLGAKMPLGIIADLEVVRKAPLRLVRAGIGDLISNLSAVEDWKLATKKNKEKFDDFAALLSINASKSVMSIGEPDIVDYKILKKIVEGLVISGIVMGIAGSSRPCSGAEHEFSHALDIICSKPALHGEQVAVGTIVATYLRGGEYKEFVSFFKKIGLPINHKELGISRKDIIKALVYAPETRPDRYTILEDIGMDEEKAIQALKDTEIIE